MPGLKTSREKHRAVETAILDALGSARRPLSYEEIADEVRRRVSKELLPDAKAVAWYTKTVQLDLEHRGKIERVQRPLRFELSRGRKRKLRQLYHMKATPQQVWEMLVDPRKIEAWSGAPAVMEAAVGGRFSLWEGEIYGENLEVVGEKRLVQRWQERGWKEPSKVTFRLRGTAEDTEVELVQQDIPEERLEDIAQGWDDYYLGAIKRHFD
ncbi:MAG: SRPBCC domain-containing protein [Chloroflexi bacterium]|nr:SRPBCC domain-containing protein [Chloroflexota bacterium]